MQQYHCKSPDGLDFSRFTQIGHQHNDHGVYPECSVIPECAVRQWRHRPARCRTRVFGRPRPRATVPGTYVPDNTPYGLRRPSDVGVRVRGAPLHKAFIGKACSAVLSRAGIRSGICFALALPDQKRTISPLRTQFLMRAARVNLINTDRRDRFMSQPTGNNGRIRQISVIMAKKSRARYQIEALKARSKLGS